MKAKLISFLFFVLFLSSSMAPAIEQVLHYFHKDLNIVLTMHSFDMESESDSTEKESDEQEEKEEKEKYNEQRFAPNKHRNANIFFEANVKILCSYLDKLYQENHVSIPTPPPRVV